MAHNKNNNITADNQRYIERQNPAYPPRGQQPVLTEHLGFNSGPTMASAQESSQDRRPDHLGYGHGVHGTGGGTVGHTQRDGTEINKVQYGDGDALTHSDRTGGGYIQRDGTAIGQGRYGRGSPPPLNNLGHGAGGHAQRVGDPAIPPTNVINHDHHGTSCGGSSLQGTVGKVESAIGSIIGSSSLKAKGLQKEQEANSLKIQGVEISEAERLEQEALIRRERAVGHGAHPANSALGGGHIGQATGTRN